jgi:hypothetical protein
LPQRAAFAPFSPDQAVRLRAIGYGLAMSERDTDFSATGNSGMPDSSRSTAEFRAFASEGGAEPEQPWNMKAPGRKVAMLVAAVIVVAVVLIIIGVAVLNA